MASRNQNRPPRSPNSRRDGDPLDKRRRVVIGKIGNPIAGDRKPLTSLNKKNEGVTCTDMAGTDGSECSSVDYSREEIDAIINERLKLKKFDHKGNLDLVNEMNSRLKVCIKWLQRKVDSHEKEEERLRNDLDSSEKKCLHLESEMKASEGTLKKSIEDLKEESQVLSEKLKREELEKRKAMESHIEERESRIAAENLHSAVSKELEMTQQKLVAANQKVASEEEAYKRQQEYVSSLHGYNVKLHADLEASRVALLRAESEKSAAVEKLTSLRGQCNSLQDQLTSARETQIEAQNLKESLSNEVRLLRSDLQQARDERDKQQKAINELNEDLLNYKDRVGKSSALLDNITEKYKSLEETCVSQKEQLNLLESQLTSANEKLKMADLSTLETRMVFEKQRDLVNDLQERLSEKERLILEGESLRKKLHNTILELKGNIRVFCRVRPSLPDDGPSADAPVLSFPTATDALGRGIDVSQNGQIFPFTFDKVFNPEASQEDVFVEISQLVQSALDGYKVCIFAYGQTGSGKTYTMMGRPEICDQKGLIPRSLEQIFEASQTLMSKGWKFKMQASMLEIYNESIRDLLSPSKPNCVENGGVSKQYNIKHDAQGTHVSDLTVIDVCSIQEISSLLRQAAQSRSVSRTMMNEQSSRSHFVFTLRISGVNEGTEQQVQGVLNLIDLAGSERLSKSGSTGDRLKETQAINKSLSCLADVIFALAKKEDHVPFRNSKLTYLLQPCLVGDSKALMFVNISPSPSSVGESLCSLRFAARVNSCEIGVPRRQLSIRQ